MNKKEKDDVILSLSTDLQIGDRSEHLVCPFCGGGDSNEASLLIWCNVDGITYKCYRAKCGAGGKVGEIGYRELSTAKRKPKLNVKQLNPEPLPSDVLAWLLGWFWWMDEDMLYLNGVMWDEYHERVLFPIKSVLGTNEGYLARRYDELILNPRNKNTPKALAYYYELPKDYKLTCMMTPHKAQFDEYAVVVEDYPSALRCNVEVPTVALSGTSIQESTLMALVKAGKTHVCVVLDADAVAKAAKLSYNYGLFFKKLTFIPLSGDDPKDMKDKVFDKLIADIKSQLDIEE